MRRVGVPHARHGAVSSRNVQTVPRSVIKHAYGGRQRVGAVGSPRAVLDRGMSSALSASTVTTRRRGAASPVPRLVESGPRPLPGLARILANRSSRRQDGKRPALFLVPTAPILATRATRIRWRHRPESRYRYSDAARAHVLLLETTPRPRPRAVSVNACSGCSSKQACRRSSTGLQSWAAGRNALPARVDREPLINLERGGGRVLLPDPVTGRA